MLITDVDGSYFIARMFNYVDSIFHELSNAGFGFVLTLLVSEIFSVVKLSGFIVLTRYISGVADGGASHFFRRQLLDPVLSRIHWKI